MPPSDRKKVTDALMGVGIGAASAITGVIAIAGELRKAGLVDVAASENIRDALLSGLLAGPIEARNDLSKAIQLQWEQYVP